MNDNKWEYRLDNYDLLRSISCISVIILHVSAMYIKDDFCGIVTPYDYAWGAFYRVMTNFAVPSFVMLSGAFLIKDKNKEYTYFYNKMIHRVVIPTLGFSVLYVLMHYAETFLAIKLEIGGISIENINYLQPLIDFVKGEPHQTMWFMFMIVGLYLITPVLIRIKESIETRTYRLLGIGLFVYGIFISYTCDLSWILWYSQWIGYFVLGNILFEMLSELTSIKQLKYNKYIGLLLIIVSYAISFLYWYIFSYDKSEVRIPESFSVVVMVGSIFQFIGFSLCRNGLKAGNMTKLISRYSMYIYLLHPLFCEILMQALGRVIQWFPSGVLIPIYSFLIGLLCCLVTRTVNILYSNFISLLLKEQ